MKFSKKMRDFAVSRKGNNHFSSKGTGRFVNGRSGMVTHKRCVMLEDGKIRAASVSVAHPTTREINLPSGEKAFFRVLGIDELKSRRSEAYEYLIP